MTDDKPQDDLIVSMSPTVFAFSCLGLAIAHGISPSQFGEYAHVAGKLFNGTWAFWVAIAVTLLIMLSFGLPSLKKAGIALAIGMIGSLSIVSLAALQLNWLVCMALFFAVLVPAGVFAFHKTTGSR